MSRSRLSPLLTAIFFLAVFMGPGPGIYLVNPSSGPGTDQTTVFGMPILYVWAVFWFFVMAVTVIVAARCVWKFDESAD